MVPAPKRGEVVRELGNELRARKDALGAMVSLDVGKILSEGLGEVRIPTKVDSDSGRRWTGCGAKRRVVTFLC